MAEPFLAEIRILSFGFPPKGFAECDGQLLPINQNQALFSLLGTTYGGDGRVNFGLPNLESRTPMHQGNGHTLGERGGEPGHTLSISEIPLHTHTANANGTTDGNSTAAANNVLAPNPSPIYGADTNLTSLNPGTLGSIGGGQAHLNMQPFLVLNFAIALQGIFPSQS